MQIRCAKSELGHMRALLAAALLATCEVVLAAPSAREGHPSTASFLERCEPAALGQSTIGNLAYCAGYLGAIFELLDLNQGNSIFDDYTVPRLCMGTGVEARELLLRVVNWIKARPTLHQGPEAGSIAAALMNLYGCRAEQPAD